MILINNNQWKNGTHKVNKLVLKIIGKDLII